jgi:hypothetical protein
MENPVKSQIHSFLALAFLAILTSKFAQAQIMMSMPTPSTKHPVTDADKLTDALRAVYVGARVPNKSDAASKEDEFHVGPHVMIVSPHESQKELQAFSHDGSNGQPYVAHLPNGHDLYLVMPFREWPQE